jgi:hypothetical protein
MLYEFHLNKLLKIKKYLNYIFPVNLMFHKNPTWLNTYFNIKMNSKLNNFF